MNKLTQDEINEVLTRPLFLRMDEDDDFYYPVFDKGHEYRTNKITMESEVKLDGEWNKIIFHSEENHLPFTRKETDYLRNLVEQEKIKVLTELTSVQRLLDKMKRKDCNANAKYFAQEKKLIDARDTLLSIENQLYPSDQKPNLI